MKGDPRLTGLDTVLEEGGVRRALFIPLLVRDEVIGALGVFKTRPRPYREGEEGLLIALSSQLAVAVQNARLHERTKELSTILERTLESERRAARQLRGLYEISQSFTESLSLDATLEAVARTMVGLLDADVAVIRMPDPREGALTARAVHVANPRLAEVVDGLAARPQPLSAPLARQLLETKKAVVLRAGMSAPDDVHRVLDPFLRRGATAAVLPLATPGEVLGTLTIVSFDPTRPLEADDIEVALAVGAQAALAIDNARLYQQQKDFSETMQRSLLPRALPGCGARRRPRLRVVRAGRRGRRPLRLRRPRGRAPRGRGRRRARQGHLGRGGHGDDEVQLPRPGARRRGAVGRARERERRRLRRDRAREIRHARLRGGRPGEPRARLRQRRSPAGQDRLAVRPREGAGRLGPPARHRARPGVPLERVELEPGSVVVLYTDGVVEARSEGELYGEERLDRLLAKNHHLSAQELASAILADCRRYSGGDLADDCAIVCLKLAR